MGGYVLRKRARAPEFFLAEVGSSHSWGLVWCPSAGRVNGLPRATSAVLFSQLDRDESADGPDRLSHEGEPVTRAKLFLGGLRQLFEGAVGSQHGRRVRPLLQHSQHRRRERRLLHAVHTSFLRERGNWSVHLRGTSFKETAGRAGRRAWELVAARLVEVAPSIGRRPRPQTAGAS